MGEKHATGGAGGGIRPTGGYDVYVSGPPKKKNGGGRDKKQAQITRQKIDGMGIFRGGGRQEKIHTETTDHPRRSASQNVPGANPKTTNQVETSVAKNEGAGGGKPNRHCLRNVENGFSIVGAQSKRKRDPKREQVKATLLNKTKKRNIL